MACGTPVLTSNVSSLPEVAGDAAPMVDPYDIEAIADGLKNLLESKTERQRLTQAGLRQAKNFTWEGAAQHLLQIYQNVLNA